MARRRRLSPKTPYYGGPPPSPQGGVGGVYDTGVPLPVVPPPISQSGVPGNPDQTPATAIGVTLRLSSPDGVASFGTRNTITVPMTCWWNYENGWSGLTFLGWQAGLATNQYGLYVDGYALDDKGNYYQSPGYFPGNMFADFLGSGNSCAWNTWNFLGTYHTSEPPRGYVPIFSDLPDLKQLVIGVSFQYQPANMGDNPIGTLGYFVSNQSNGSDQIVTWGLKTPANPPYYLPGYFHAFPPVQFPPVTVSISQWGDMAKGMPGKQIADGDGFNPAGVIVDWDHRGTLQSYTPSPPSPSPAFLPQWDTSWMQGLTEPFIITPGQWPVNGQVMPITPWGHVPFGWTNATPGTIFWNHWDDLQYYNLFPIAPVIGYFIPPGVAFGTPVNPEIPGQSAYYIDVQMDPPTSPTYAGPPPGVIYGAYMGSGGPFDVLYNPEPFYVHGFGFDFDVSSSTFPVNSFIRTSTGVANTLVFLKVPWGGPPLYLSSFGPPFIIPGSINYWRTFQSSTPS